MDNADFNPFPRGSEYQKKYKVTTTLVDYVLANNEEDAVKKVEASRVSDKVGNLPSLQEVKAEECEWKRLGNNRGGWFG